MGEPNGERAEEVIKSRTFSIPTLKRIIKWEKTTLRHSLILKFLETGLAF